MDNKKQKIHCLKCDDYIEGDLLGNPISCKCKACFIDQTPYYYRINGDFNKIEIEDNNKWILLSDYNK